MKFFERHFPLPGWILKGIRARVLTPHMLTIGAETRAALASARTAEAPVIDPMEFPESAVLQTRLFKPEHVQFKPIDADIDNIQLLDNQVLFVPQSFILNKYILYYNRAYLRTNIDGFVDPAGELNSLSFKTIPAWGISYVYRSNHPDIIEGTAYHGFFPISPYSVRCVENVNRDEGTALQRLPKFGGPREWLRLVKTDDHSEFVADLFEYFKIGITFAGALRDIDYYDAEQLVFSSASSASAQIIAMCVKELRPDFRIIGLTSPRNLEMVKGFSYFDEVYTYDDIASSDGGKPTLYFDALGTESVSLSCFDHYRSIKRWWIYGQGGEKSQSTFLKINRRGTLYANLIDSYLYANHHGISDRDILDKSEALNKKHDLERRWGNRYRTISSPRELYELYTGFINNTHPSGERVQYVSPLMKHT
jgi:Protein of unknown function (DUF2855)